MYQLYMSLKPGEALGDLINLAQGIRKGNQQVIEIISPTGDEETYNFPVRSNISLEDGYSVHIPMYLPSTREIFTVKVSWSSKKSRGVCNSTRRNLV